MGDPGKGADEGFGGAGVDGVAETAQLSHAAGYPMSQQTNAGFNPPGFAIGSDDPVGIMAAARAGRVAPTISGGVYPDNSSASCSSPGGLLLPPPERLPLFSLVVMAFRLLRFMVTGVCHVAIA
jgi:hypothetical protein